MFEYRLCNEKDCSVWIAMNREFMRAEIMNEKLWNGTENESDAVFRQTFLDGLKETEHVRFLLFEEDEEPVGFANLVLFYSVWAHGKAMIVDDLYFTPGNRGRGFGARAMELIEDYAQELGCKRIQFQSELSNPDAMAFYKAIGYEPADMHFYVKYFEDNDE